MNTKFIVWICICLFLVSLIIILEYTKRKKKNKIEVMEYEYYRVLMKILGKLLISKDKGITLDSISIPFVQRTIPIDNIVRDLNEFPLIHCVFDSTTRAIVLDTNETKKAFAKFVENVEENRK